MEVAGLCAVCQRPGVLSTCAMCGTIGHPQCLTGALHGHGGPPGVQI